MIRFPSRALVCAGVLVAVLGCAQAAEPQPAQADAAIKRKAGGSLSAEGAALSGQGSSLAGATSGLGAYETDLGTALSLSADVLFDFDKAELKPAATPTLQRLGDLIKQKQPKQVQIHGHSDGIGADAYNLKLSQRRAEAVAVWLTRNGVAAELLASKGFGASNPVAPNRKPDGSDNPDGRQKNRRVDVLLAKQFSAITPLTPRP